MTKTSGLSTLRWVFAVAILCASAFSQTSPPFALMPIPRQCFTGAGGVPLSGGFIATYLTGTTTPAPTYYDASGLYPQQEPVNLDSNGCASIWLAPLSYTIVAMDQNSVQQWTVNNVSDVGQLLYAHAIVNNPTNGAQQTIAGPLGATFFLGTIAHTTSPGVRVSLLDPATMLDTPSNPPLVASTTPAKANQVYQVPDPAAQDANFVLSPGPPDWAASTLYALGQQINPSANNPCGFSFTVSTAGTSNTIAPIFSTTPCSGSAATVNDNGVIWTSNGVLTLGNTLDCTKSGITCIRNSYVYFEGGGCNNATSALGWDTFGTNAPTPICQTGANVTKGVLAFPSAATLIQQNTGSATPATSVTVTYTNATTGGDLLVAEISADGSHTVSGCTDGTNAYSKAANVTNGALDVEIWYFNGNSTAMAAASTLTCTLSGSSNAAINWKEYSGILTSGMLDRTNTNTGTGTAVTTNSTAGTTQNVELVLAAVGTINSPAITAQAGYVKHTSSSSPGNTEVASEGLIQQVAAAQGGTFTLGSSVAWGAIVATFKANVAGIVTAQRGWGLPNFYLANQPVNAYFKWEPSQITATSGGNVRFGANVACTADGSTDDPAFNFAITANPATNLASPNIVTTTPLLSLPMIGCAAGNLMHFQVERLRYDPLDTFEGFVYLVGAGLQFGINQ